MCRCESAWAAGTCLRTGIHMVHDGILLRRIEVRRLEHEAVKVSLTIARLYRNRDWRYPSGREQLRDILLRNLGHELTAGVAEHRYLRLRCRRRHIDEILAIGRS